MPSFQGQSIIPTCDRKIRNGGRLPVTAVTAVALLLGSPAPAAERPQPTVTSGPDGRNGQANAIFSNVAATPGRDGGDVTLIDVDPTAAGRDAAATIQ
ncbi:hypothetical protein FV228_13845, partial [Methylobacterium sp. WL18]